MLVFSRRLSVQYIPSAATDGFRVERYSALKHFKPEFLIELLPPY